MENRKPNWTYKTFWTAVSAVLGVLVVAVADLPYWWAAALIPVINAAHAYVREQLEGLSDALGG